MKHRCLSWDTWTAGHYFTTAPSQRTGYELYIRDARDGTMMCWVYPTDVSTDMPWFSKSQNGSGHLLGSGGSTRPYCRVSNTAGNRNRAVRVIGDINADEWLFVAYVFDTGTNANNLHIYYSQNLERLQDTGTYATRQAQGVYPMAPNLSTNGDLYIGTSDNGGAAGNWDRMKGRIFMVAAFSEYMSFADVERQMWNPDPYRPTCEFMSFPGYDGLGVFQRDWSKNQNHFVYFSGAFSALSLQPGPDGVEIPDWRGPEWPASNVIAAAASPKSRAGLLSAGLLQGKGIYAGGRL